MTHRISIYDGEGTSLHLRDAFRTLDPLFLQAKDLLEGALDRTEVFIMPGGRDRPYHAALKGPGNEKIRSFVEQGGVYIGICAGAYYGCQKIVFDPGHPLEVCEERELGFFPGSAIGPAFGFGTFDYRSQKGARAALLETEEGQFHAYYNGGCYFEGDLSDCKILARYSDLPGKPVAIIARPVGEGLVILSGVHIETPADLLANAESIVPLLQKSEKKRKAFWSKLVIN